MNMLRNGVTWLNATAKASLSDTVTYRRGGIALVGLQATPGQNDFAIDGALGVRIESDNQDWIVTASDLILSGAVILPQRGDVISFSSGASYEVQSPDGQTQPYSLDSTGLRLRIHCKRIA